MLRRVFSVLSQSMQASVMTKGIGLLLSAALPDRLALLAEGAHALIGILGVQSGNQRRQAQRLRLLRREMAGAPHHTVLSTAIPTEVIEDFAVMTDTELLVIDAETTVRGFTRELKWNNVYHHVAAGL